MRSSRIQTRTHTPSGPRLVVSACAHEGGGKSTFLLTAPKPIHLFMIDPNTEEICKKAGLLDDDGEPVSDDLIVYRVGYPAVAFGDKDEIKEQAEKIWERDFIDPMKALLHSKPKGTIGIDTATELKDLQMLKWFGKTAQIIKELYTGPNMELKGLYNSLGHSGVNVVLLHRLKDVYADKEVRTRSGPDTVREKVPGVFERDGWNKTGFYVNTEVHLFHDPTRSDKLARQYGMKVTRCTARPGLIGQEFWNRAKVRDAEGEPTDERVSVTFPWLASQVYPKTEPSDWT